ncbi:MAG: KR domain protein [Promethearchaeota archaeon CR_4]|nr:MAG: KR domain protein [Candidatus Lokiarchaeota archaeon CR_4]
MGLPVAPEVLVLEKRKVERNMKIKRYFRGKNAIITGAASGIGRAFAEQLAAIGTNLVLSDINMERLEMVKQALIKYPIQVVTSLCDVTKEKDVEELAKLTVGTFKTVDFLFSNAGTAMGGHIENISMIQWQTIIQINIIGMINCVRAFLPKMLEQQSGHIIVTSSICGSIGTGGLIPYTTTKFANSGFCEALYGECKGRGINVSIVSPFPLKTNLIEEAGIIIPPGLLDGISPEIAKAAINKGKQYYWENFCARKGLISGFCGGMEVDIAVENYLRKIANKKLYIFERWHGRFFQFVRGWWPSLYKRTLLLLGNRSIKLFDKAFEIAQSSVP